MLRVGGCRNVIRDSNLFSSSFSFLFFLGGAPDVSRENRALCPIQATEDFDFPREGSFGQNFLYFLTMRNSSWRISVMPRFLYRMYSPSVSSRMSSSTSMSNLAGSYSRRTSASSML